MSVGVTGREGKHMRKALSQGRLQTVVVGMAIVLRLIDKPQVGEFGGVGSDARDWIGLIEADKIRQSVAVSADVAHLQREVAAEGVLDTQVEIHDVRRDIMRVYRHDGARFAGSARKYGALRENGAIPVELGARELGVGEIDGAAVSRRTRGSGSYGRFAGARRDVGQARTPEVVWR